MPLQCVRCRRWPCDCPDGITLIQHDCRVIAQEFAGAFDMVLADPPYGETDLQWDRWPATWPGAMLDALKPAGSLWCFGTLRMFLAQAAEFAGFRVVQDVIWEKHNGSGFLVDRFRRVHETAVHYVPKACKWPDVYKCPQFTHDAKKRKVRRQATPAHWHGYRNANSFEATEGGPRQMRSVVFARSSHGRSHHPTEKPLPILTPLIEYSCPPDGLLFSPFAGSGSDLVAAKQCGRRAIGVEIDPKFIAVAVDRLRQQHLFTGASL